MKNEKLKPSSKEYQRFEKLAKQIIAVPKRDRQATGRIREKESGEERKA
jgi:hypothetical protein